jgi:hypothetical protein
LTFTTLIFSLKTAKPKNFIPLTFVDQCSDLKESAIRALLARHAHEITELTEEFLLDKLHIPIEWIDEAKVQKKILLIFLFFTEFLYVLQQRSSFRNSLCSQVKTVEQSSRIDSKCISSRIDIKR